MKRVVRCLYVVILALLVWFIWSFNNERLRLNAMSRLSKGGWDLYFTRSPTSIPWARRLWIAMLPDVLPPDYIKDVEGIAVGGANEEQTRLVDCIKHISTIRGVYVPNNLHLSADFFASLSSLPNLRRLNLDGSNVDDDMLSSFSGAPMIESITMYYAVNVHGESLERYKSLKELIGSESGIDDKGLHIIARHCPLFRMDLDGTNISKEALKHLEGMMSLHLLTLPKRAFDSGPELDHFRQKRPEVKVSH
jgi:hypothetical protein